MDYSFQIKPFAMTTFLCRIQCSLAHSRKSIYSCLKCSLTLCNKCQANVNYLSYVYYSKITFKPMCLPHFIYHFPVLHCWKIDGGETLALYNPLLNTRKYFTMTGKPNYYSDTIAFHYKIFFMGGANPDINDVSQLNVKSMKLTSKDRMLTCKHEAALCIASEKIYSIGGYRQGFLSECQKYSIKLDKWEKLPNLNHEKNNLASVVFNENQIYAIGGNSYYNNPDRFIERLGINKDKKWELIEMPDFEHVKNCKAIQIRPNEILVFAPFNKSSKGVK